MIGPTRPPVTYTVRDNAEDTHDEHLDVRAVTVSARPRTDLPAQWPPRRIAAAALATVVFALAVGVPTGLVPTPLYTRMTPVLWWNYVVWAVTAALGGLVVATYVRRPHDRAPRNGAAAASGGGLLTAFAVGCPVCNKLVVATLGVSGAMTLWAPLQPVLAVLSIVGLGWALRRRLQNEYACSASSDGRKRAPTPDGSATHPVPHHGSSEVSTTWSLAATLAPPCPTETPPSSTRC